MNWDCGYHAKRGWWCSRGIWHPGPCALRPRWWNLSHRVNRLLARRSR